MITLNRRERMTLAVTAAVLLTLPALHPLYADGHWALRCAGAVVTIGVVGFLGRVLRLPVVLQPVLAVLTLLLYAAVVFAGSTLSLIVPTADTFRVMGDLLSGGSDDISTLIAPVPTSDGLVLIGVLAVGGIAVVVDTVAVVLGRAALAGLPLLLLFAAPAAIGDAGAGWWSFALAGLGWLLLLLADGTERVHRWGVALSAPGTRSRAGGGLGYAGSRIGVLAVALAVAVPFLLPDVGDASGRNGDDGPRTITTYNPLTKLKGELSLPSPRTILTYSTDDPDPDYLRMTTLAKYDGQGWSQDSLSGRPSEDGVEGRTLPDPVGLDEQTTTSTAVTAKIAIANLDARWLPAPATPSIVDVNGPWMWDEQSETVFATRSDTNQVDPYTVTSIKADPTAAALRAAPATLPEDIQRFAVAPVATDRVKAITRQVTAGARTAYAKGKALQDYFRGGDNGFEYSLRTVSGSSPDALQNFLETKRGYCEQYASAMAAMLRLSGVPARVAVGFTPGRANGDGSYV